MRQKNKLFFTNIKSQFRYITLYKIAPVKYHHIGKLMPHKDDHVGRSGQNL